MAKKNSLAVNPAFELLSIRQFSNLAMTFWVGGTLTIGSIIIPLLFRTLDEITAASLTGQILNINAYLGIVALSLAGLDISLRYKFKAPQLRAFWYIIILLAIIIVNYFAIFPIIAKFKTTLNQVTNVVIPHHNAFRFWHSISSILFLVSCILGIIYTLDKK